MKFEKIKSFIVERSVQLFEYVLSIVLGITVVAALISCFILFSYKGIKYIYTFVQSEISEYHQKKEDSLNVKITIEARRAFGTYKESGLSGLVSMSKNRYDSLRSDSVNIENLYQVATIDLVGEYFDEEFLDHFSEIVRRSNHEVMQNLAGDALRSEYFKKSSTNSRLDRIRTPISNDSLPDNETMRFYIQKIIRMLAAEQLGHDNKLNNQTAKNIVETTIFFAQDFVDSFGLAGLQKFSQYCYRDLERSKVISLSQIEKCFVVDVFEITYSVFKKMPRSTVTEYFAKESARNRPAAFFNKLGIAEDDAQKYRQGWVSEFIDQSEEYFQRFEE